VNDLAKEMAPKTAVAEAPTCKVKVGEKLRHVMSLDIQIDSSSNAVFLSSFLPLIQTQWVSQTSASGGWRMVNTLPAPSMSNNMTLYERALIGNRPDQLPWSAKLHVKTEQIEAPGIAGLLGEKGSNFFVHMRLQVAGTDGQNVAYEDITSFGLEMEKSAWSAPKLQLSSITALQNELQTMRSQAEEWLACQSVHPVVTAVASKQVEINAGSLAGVKKGDEWLVANPARFPAELMSKDGAPQTLLAKVQSVTPFHSQLVVLAGPAQSAQAEWRVWPTDTFVKEPNLLPKPVVLTTSKRSVKPVAISGPAVATPPY
jgi:hypothetical protein